MNTAVKSNAPFFKQPLKSQPMLSAKAQSRQANPVHFGCRVFAYLSSTPYAGQDEFIRQCLTTGGNSMKRQNQLALEEEGDTRQVAEENFPGIHEKTVRKAGWGIVYAPEPAKGQATGNAPAKLHMEKSPLAVWKDNKHFTQVAEKAATSQPKVVLAHLRESHRTPVQAKSVENTHPFRHGDWALMHHGDFPAAVTKDLEAQLKAWHAKDPGSPLPKGEVDSERIACYMAARFRQRYGSPNITHLPTEQVRDDFKEFAREIISNPHSKSGQGHTGTYNLVMSDGNRIFGTHYSATPDNLFIGSHRSPEGRREALLTTDPIQPLPDSGHAKINWQPVDNNSVISMERFQDSFDVTQVNYKCRPLLPEAPPVANHTPDSFAEHLMAAPRQLWNQLTAMAHSVMESLRNFFQNLTR